IEQMQNRVLDAADILVDGHPIIGLFRLDGLPGMWRAKAREIPGAVDKSIAGIGLACGFAAASWAIDVLPGWMAVERISRFVERNIVRQEHGQVLFRYRHDTAFRTV